MIAKALVYRPKLSAAVLAVMVMSGLAESLGLALIFPILALVINEQGEAVGVADKLQWLPMQFSPELLFHSAVGAFLILMLLRFLTHLYQKVLIAKIGHRLGFDWSMNIMSKYMHSEYLNMASRKRGDLMNDIVNEPAAASLVVRLSLQFFADTILLLLLMLVLLATDWQITLLTMAVGLLFGVVGGRLLFGFSRFAGNERLRLGRRNLSIINEMLGAIKQVKIFSLERMAYEELKENSYKWFRLYFRFMIANDIPNTISPLLVSFIIVGLVYYGYFASASSFALFIPKLAVFVVIGPRILSAIARQLSLVSKLLQGLPALKTVLTWLDEAHVPQERIDGGAPIDRIGSDIEFRNVVFAYPNSDPLFDGLNMRFRLGTSTAVIGPSGAGKSTIADLLVGLYFPNSGSVVVNGCELSTLHLREWRNLIGYVSQDTCLFNASVRDNIRLGAPGASDEEVERAARVADAHDFITGLPNGYDAILGDNGVFISGGQRQRIAIARAIVRRPRLYIFDEATSALDIETERRILVNLSKLEDGSTFVVISHRYETVKNTDYVYVLEAGRIVAEGQGNVLDGKTGFLDAMRSTA